ncbi:hypothetical protein M0R45_025554 [Rubus argutus]|uniref:COG4 transport protein middle alpha-helical bundle domain-containing protein n=1 Tax=Rubus argutus TaxID=59490 RepID=A0AAW1WUY9_RUBAR
MALEQPLISRLYTPLALEEEQPLIPLVLSAAVDQRDHPTALRFIMLYTPLGLEEEGLQVYVSYLRKDIVLAIEDNDKILRSLCGEDGIVYSICELQEDCDSRGTLIMKKYMEYRKLCKLSSEINAQNTNLLNVGGVGVGVGSEGPGPREVELYLEERLFLMQLGEDYTELMLSKVKGLTNINPDLGPRATKAFRSGSFSKVVQDITGYYVILEGFFMVENVRKDIRIYEYMSNSLTTSIVDYLFYVLQNCLRRAILTLNISSAITVLSGASSLLSTEYQDALQQKVRDPNLSVKLFLGVVGVQKTGAEIATVLENMHVRSELVLKLKHGIEEQCLELIDMRLFYTLLCALLFKICNMHDQLSEAEYVDNEVNDPWVQRLLHIVETNVAWLQMLLTVNNYDSFVHLVIKFLVKSPEVIMMQRRFSQLGGLQLNRDTRALVSHFSSMTQRIVRDKFARLTQMITILNLEKVSEILDFWAIAALKL